ncbi:MAG: hypothetical protein ACKVT1_08040 [Dehalococcoidia bacterium]
MTTTRTIGPAEAQPMTEAGAARSECALDRVIEDSFPASDAPSHTPLTGLGPPRGKPAASAGRDRE